MALGQAGASWSLPLLRREAHLFPETSDLRGVVQRWTPWRGAGRGAGLWRRRRLCRGEKTAEPTVRRIPVLNAPPREEDVCQIYVSYPGEDEMSDVIVFCYLEGAWRQLFNNGQLQMDWRPAIEPCRKRARKGLELMK